MKEVLAWASRSRRASRRKILKNFGGWRGMEKKELEGTKRYKLPVIK